MGCIHDYDRGIWRRRPSDFGRESRSDGPNGGQYRPMFTGLVARLLISSGDEDRSNEELIQMIQWLEKKVELLATNRSKNGDVQSH